ncbi:mandelate racemase/muconate lactonizing enzyme family protein [Candidatus Latescibacterota bacterium]
MRNKTGKKNIKRREFFERITAAGAIAGVVSPFKYASAAITPGEKGIYITNIYRTHVKNSSGWWSSDWAGAIIRVETNKGIVGYGECRDLDRESEEWLGKLAPHIVGMNPTQVEKVYNTMVENFIFAEDLADQEIEGTGAISAIETACWDIVGKVYNMPVYKLLGPRVNDKIVMYGDTDGNSVQDIEARVEKGFKHYKCDMYLSRIARGNYTKSSTTNKYGCNEITINQSGLDQMHAYMEQYREVLQSYGEPYASAPIGSDHYQGYGAGLDNQLSVESAIALANTLNEDHNPNGYVEDIIDWWIDGGSGLPCKEVADGTDMRLQTGEDMFGFDQLKVFADAGGLDNFHPEPNTFGGINQTLIAAKYAAEKGIRNYYHNSSGPIAMASYAHIAAATPNFVALEYHQMDISWHDDLVDGIEKPMIQDGMMSVPEGPGLGVTPNEEAFAAHGAGTWTKVI